jgi:serine/threonine protein kinase
MSEDIRGARRAGAETPWPSFALPRGTTVNGYRIERILGSGGFGITYLATDLLGQRFAIKEFYPRQFATRRDMTVRPNTVEDTELFDECKERFLREAHALVRLGGVADAADGIVRVKTYFEAFGTGFLVMDYVAGESLAVMLRREPAGLPPDKVRSLLVQLLASARIVHQAGLVHRDIKPANIILRENDRLVLIDFGATRHATPTDTSYTQIYSGGYGPPEQMLGLRQGEFSDIYAIGAVCYRAIGGSVVNSLARQNSLAAGRTDPLAPAVEIGTGRYPRPLLAAIDAALAVDPAQRPQNVDAMLTLLGREHAPAPPTTQPAAASAPLRRRRPGWAVAIAVGVVATAGVAAYLLVPARAPRPVAELREPEPSAPRKSAAEQRGEPSAPPASQAPEPQREVGLTPPPAVSPPSVPPPSVSPPVPVVSPLDRVQSLAASVPCAALKLADSNDAVRVSGFAAAAPELDRLLAEAQDAGRVIDAVTRVDRFACPALTTVAPLVRRAENSGASALALGLEQSGVAVGGRLGVSIATSRPAVYLDLYQPDGSVRHLLRPAQSRTTGRRSVEWMATLPAGPRLFVAMAADSALALGPRADTERASDYLEILRTRLADGPPDVLGDLGMVIVRPAEVRPAEPVAAKPPPRQNNVRSDRCANIISRAQLGETLSNAEITALQNECRS